MDIECPMSSSSSSSSARDLSPCPICLNSLHQEAYLDRCFHKFCYSCILHWARVLASKNHSSKSSLLCPLCKVENFSIIHDYDGHSYQQHYIGQNIEERFSFSGVQRYRFQLYHQKPGTIYTKFDVLKFWKCHRYLQPNKWLETWLRRELQALTQEEDVNIIVHHVLGLTESFWKRNQAQRSMDRPEEKRERFKAFLCDAVGPFLLVRAERFVDEVELFLASGLNIEAYDEVYLQSLSEDSSSTSDSAGENPHERASEVPYAHFFEQDMDAAE